MTDPQPITATMPAWPHPLTVTLPLPPSTNGAYRNVAGKGRVLTTEASAWKDAAAWAVRLALCDTPAPEPPLVLSLFVYLPNDRRADISNRIKLVEDVVCAMLGVDDRHVHALHCYRRIDRANPRLVVVVGEAREG